MRFAVVGVELSIGEQNRRAGMVEIRARPENTFLFVDSFIGDAVVIGDSPAGGDAKLLENVRWVLEWEILAPPQAMGDIDNDVGIASCLAGRIDAFLPVDDAPFGAASQAIF